MDVKKFFKYAMCVVFALFVLMLAKIVLAVILALLVTHFAS